MSLFDNLPHTINLSRVGVNRDELLGETHDKDPTPYLEDEPAFVQPASQREVLEFKARDQAVTHKVYVNSLPTGIVLTDILDVTYGPYAGTSLVVKGWLEATAGVTDKWKIMGEITREA
jgi:hypothetical protein